MESLTAPKTIDHQANFHSATFFEIKVFNNLDRPVIWKMFTNNTEKRPKSGFVFAKKPAIIEVHVHPVKLTVNQKPRLSDKILIKSFPSTYTAINEVLNKENFIEQLFEGTKAQIAHNMVLINIFLVNEDNVQNEPIEPFIDEDEQNAVVKLIKMEVEEAKNILIDEKANIALRMDAVFTLKSINTVEAIYALSSGFESKSNLLTHEIAYVLGQMQNTAAVPVLQRVLCDNKYAPITRHEAAEALAAIGHFESIPLLKKFSEDSDINVAETCVLAIDTLNYKQYCISGQKEWIKSPKYISIDPAPPARSDDVPSLENTLLDESKSLFERYRALFKLREIGSPAAVLAICRGFDSRGDLFRHEIAYVLGQLQEKESLPALFHVLENGRDHPMVRHEAAEAIGSVSGREAEEKLKCFLGDAERVVRESCVVALDMAEFWADGVEVAE